MTEAQWLACSAPGAMLDVLDGRASQRKSRLFAVACVLHWPDPTGIGSVPPWAEFAERYADGLATSAELAFARKRAPKPDRFAGLFAQWVLSRDPHELPPFLALRVAPHQALWSDLLREVFGNPFRPVVIEKTLITSSALAVARTI